MLQVSAAHQRVLNSDDARGVSLLDITTFSGNRKIAIGDYAITVGSDVYVATQNISWRQTTEFSGIGTARYQMVSDISRKGWFVDNAGNIKTANAVCKLLFSLYDEENGVFLAPFQFLTLRAEPAQYDERFITVEWRDRFAANREQRWRLSRNHQRTVVDKADSSIDNVSKKRPQRAVNV